MNKKDSVLCVACGGEFEVGLVELVRWVGPLRCQMCSEDCEEALQRAGRGEEIAEDQR
jgi:hypothetical protein